MERTTRCPDEKVLLVKNLLIPMRDGVHLAADLYMPREGFSQTSDAKHPIVVEYIPYRKDEAAPGTRFYEYLVHHGYIVARVDIRSTGASEGISTDEYLEQEQLDGYDMIEWLARQSFCDGNVNMMGISYGGFSALQVATHNPPHLRSIIPIDFTDDRYTDDCHYRGGLLRMYYDVTVYGNFMIAYNALPPYAEWSGAEWAKLWEQRLSSNEPYLLKWLKHQTDGPYWRHGSVREIADRIKCPVFLIGGWRDGYPNPPLRLYQNLKVPRKVLIGPWNHIWPDVAVPGPRIDYLHEVVRWLDYWCKGKNTGIMDEAPVVVYMHHSEKPVVDRIESAGEWRAETTWPPPETAEKTLYRGKDGSLVDYPDEEGEDPFAYNPTVGVTGGLWSGGLPFGLPGDQRADEAYSLVYTSAPLEKDLCMFGWPRAILHISSSASVVGFAASLCDVAPGGSSHLVAKGMLNATRRESLTHPKPLTPGEIYELDIQIDAMAWCFSKGHRIRLNIASADWPNVWPTPQPAMNTIYWGKKRASQLILPTVAATGSAAPPPFRPSSKTIMRQSAAVRPPTWQIIQDVLTGWTTVNLQSETDYRVNETTVIHREYSAAAKVDSNDPSSASIQGRHLSRIARPQHTVEGRSEVVIQGTATHFHVTIDLVISTNNVPHFSKRWIESVPRQLL